ncbi:hypothetical protein IPL85_00790 [Candidatus Saccharibacteria bacterium]|nr:MAG: hypothetical protein IPL85_00790 [Candidatus Saccharibacteria bacterium]
MPEIAQPASLTDLMGTGYEDRLFISSATVATATETATLALVFGGLGLFAWLQKIYG